MKTAGATRAPVQEASVAVIEGDDGAPVFPLVTPVLPLVPPFPVEVIAAPKRDSYRPRPLVVIEVDLSSHVDSRRDE